MRGASRLDSYGVRGVSPTAVSRGAWLKAVLSLQVLAHFGGAFLAAQLPPPIQADRLLVRAERQIGEGAFAAAVATLDSILALQDEHGLEIPVEFWFKRAQVSQDAGLHAKAAESATRYLIEAGAAGENYRAALELLDTVLASPEGERWRREVELAELPPGETFRDRLRSGAMAPEMIVIPAGSFQMGCVSGRDCFGDELPVHEVTIPRTFSASKYEVTFAEWDSCVSAGGCRHRPNDEGWGRGRHPVIGVSWQDAQDYVLWLSQQTGATYRLLSESEWEYAARAGTGTAFSWGNQIVGGRANCYGDFCNEPWSNTAPVGSFSPNAWGLYDMHGNASEWVQDCWTRSYNGAPSDGSAWQEASCPGRVVRGGSWDLQPWFLRSAIRFQSSSDFRFATIGLRVARTLTARTTAP